MYVRPQPVSCIVIQCHRINKQQGAIHSISVVPEFLEKEDNLESITIFETFLSKISVPFHFPPGISGCLGRAPGLRVCVLFPLLTFKHSFESVDRQAIGSGNAYGHEVSQLSKVQCDFIIV